MRPVFLNESCLQWSFGDQLDESVIRQTLAAFRRLDSSRALRKLGVLDVVPSYNKLAVHFCGSEQRHSEIAACIADLLSEDLSQAVEACELHRIPVNYCGEDLPRVARLSGLAVDDVISLHSEPEYLVAMVGFQPHFPYLFGLHEKLATPRLETPRLRVPAGAVAIGGAQTGVYPAESPGGWNLVGQTDPARLLALRPGDRVRFEPC